MSFQRSIITYTNYNLVKKMHFIITFAYHLSFLFSIFLVLKVKTLRKKWERGWEKWPIKLPTVALFASNKSPLVNVFWELVGGTYRVNLWIQKFALFFFIMLLSYVIQIFGKTLFKNSRGVFRVLLANLSKSFNYVTHDLIIAKLEAYCFHVDTKR